ncbi:hypothetical protein BDF22DRAFT_745088 [Syncephalis plumigaleata]|nr:hypothetical protein BDF22DRAFT_745088 [Syncephalis plumigaleata]
MANDNEQSTFATCLAYERTGNVQVSLPSSEVANSIHSHHEENMQAGTVTTASMMQLQCLLSIPSVECYRVFHGHQRLLASGLLVVRHGYIYSNDASDAPPSYDVVLVNIGEHFQIPLVYRGRAWRCGRMQWMVSVSGEEFPVKLVFDMQTCKEHILEWHQLLERYTIYDPDAWEELIFTDDIAAIPTDPLPSYEYVLMEIVFMAYSRSVSNWMIGVSNAAADKLRRVGGTIGTIAYLTTRNIRQRNLAPCTSLKAIPIQTNRIYTASGNIQGHVLAMAQHTGQLTNAITSIGQSALKGLSQLLFGQEREIMAYSSSLHRVRGQTGIAVDILCQGVMEGAQSATSSVFESFATFVEYRYGTNTEQFIRQVVHNITQRESIED